ncbi:unnamed protein product [Penicillium salamii]|uniref:RTA-like protein n=1 Tax=Penicillium salamii TaxID=1612424 RepID=A0A9W4IDH7_9EURO|nr:unnamed protein product [Penicillium salamii]
MAYLLYNYKPSLPAAVIFVVLFFIASLTHIFLAYKHKTKFLVAFIIGGLMEAIGYATRAINAHQSPNYSTMPYALQSLFILLAPSLFAASIYMILGRIIRLTHGDSRSIIRPSRLTKIFVLGDVLSFLIQSGGGGIMSSAKSETSLKRGEHVIIVGLIVQIIFFGFFCVVAVMFQQRITQSPTEWSLKTLGLWRRYLLVLYVASLLIMVRCVYRVMEYLQGQTGMLQSHEYFAYIFDALLMFAIMVIFMIFHPRQIVPDEKESDQSGLMYGRLSD